ncbi:MAG: epoxyqueuosine reductase [Gemmatimonadota bacterium]|nr:MAG: epoxyqueuosine reductase [Gemmatimonadota bacterium]
MGLNDQNYALLKEHCLREGSTLFGVADVRQIRQTFRLPSIKEELDCGISLGVRLSGAVLAEIEDGPTLLYAWHYRQANIVLDRVAFRLSEYIQEQGYRALPIAASQIIDWRQQIAHLSHKHVGVLAGHGWIGRNNLLVHPQYGATVRYVTVLTDMPLPTAKPLEFGCNACRRCLSVCPSQALGETPEDYNFDRCFEQLKAFRDKRKIGHYICGLCVKVCKGKSVHGKSQTSSQGEIDHSSDGHC